MISLASFMTPPSQCGYLADRTWQLQYEFVAQATAAEYEDRLLAGWRRFGRAWFRPQCPACRACQPLRVEAAHFRPDRSQRRNQRLHQNSTELQIGRPSVTDEKLALYDRFHEFQTYNVGWPSKPPKDGQEYIDSFVDNPFPTEEWSYFREGRLVGVGYVDVLPRSLSAIYFFHEPYCRSLGLGTWNVLSCIAQANRRGLLHVYLGYFVEGCRSLEYKSHFRPASVLNWEAGQWGEFTVR
jgi:arginine-tRNA-protein transferase